MLLYFPLIWNTRALWMLLSLAGLHLAFYLSGWWYFDTYLKIQGYPESTSIMGGSNIAYAAIISILLIIVWLVFYLRNNPFKSFYPLPRGYFAIEFAIIFLVLTGCINLPRSFAKGFYDHVEHQSHGVNLTEEINTVNLAYALIPENQFDYDAYNRCDSLEYRETRAYIDSIARMDSLDRIRLQAYRDSVGNDEADLAEERAQRKKDLEHHDYSYLNFCKQYTGDYDTSAMDRRAISAKLQLMLTSNNKAEVAAILNRFEHICLKYKIDYNVNIPSYTAMAFKDDRHRPSVYLNISEERHTLDFESLNRVLSHIHQARTRTFDGTEWLITLYIALFMALALFSFRLSSTRVWLISLVGAGVISVIYGIIAALVRGEYFALGGAITLIVLFYLIYQISLRARRKTMAGVNLVWFTWAFPGLPLLIHGLISELSRPRSIYNPKTLAYVMETPSALYTFLEDHQSALETFYFVFILLVVTTLLYRHYRTWQAMDEE